MVECVEHAWKELQGWGIVKVGVCDGGIGGITLSRSMMCGRAVSDHYGGANKKRELDPTVAMLKECVLAAKEEGDELAHRRLADLADFVENGGEFLRAVRRLPAGGLKQFAKRWGRW